MKRITIWAIGAALVFGLFGHVLPAMANNSGASVSQGEAEYLEQSFNATGATATGFLIHDYSTVNQHFMSPSDLLNLAKTMASDLGLTNVTAGKRIGQNEHILQLSGTWSKKISVSIVLSSFHMTDGMPDSTILVFRAKSGTGDLSELAAKMTAISSELNRQHIYPSLDAYIAGYIQPELSDQQTNQVIAKAFDAVQAKRIEGLSSNLVTSISGYSPNGPTYILSNYKRMNLQVALHWDEYNKHTNVIAGTPIIVDPYWVCAFPRQKLKHISPS